MTSSTRNRHAFLVLVLLLVSGVALAACGNDTAADGALSRDDVAAIRALNDAYVQAWRRGDTTAVLNTLDAEAVLMPAGLAPITGLDRIKQFWWPDDGSRTVITDYSMNVQEVGGSGDIAYSRSRAQIAFTYEKGGETTEQRNTTMSLTVYRRQSDGTWRILRRMWGALRQ